MTGQSAITVDKDSEILRRALRRLPVPEPRPGFVDRVLAHAGTAHADRHARRTVARPGRLRHLARRWETWTGAALGAAVAATLTLIVLRPVGHTQSPPAIALSLHEARDIEVLIDSERALKDATIRIAVSGSVALDGFDSEREIDWQADLERGSNLLALPIFARSAGKGRLVAVIEHEGRSRQVTIDLTVQNREASRS